MKHDVSLLKERNMSKLMRECDIAVSAVIAEVLRGMNRDMRSEMSRKMQSLVDGKGAGRIADVIISLAASVCYNFSQCQKFKHRF